MLILASALKNPLVPPVEDAALWVEGDSIWFAGPKSDLPREAWEDPQQLDLGDAVLAPGLVNAHSHLELTSLGKLEYPGCFVSWIQDVLQAKQTLSPAENERAMPKGIMQSLLGGATTIGDHLGVMGDLEALMYSPLRGKIFLEVLGVVPEVARDIFSAARSMKQAYQGFPSLLEIIPTPHSVHALVPDVLYEVLEQRHSVFSLHLGESEAERRYFSAHDGPMEKFIASRGSSLKREADSALRELANLKALDSRLLAVHGNYFLEEELRQLAEAGASVVHCPLSHRYFGHATFPMASALENRLNVALGTDSLASAASLSMFEVMRATLEDHPYLDEEKIFSMATLGGATALKLESDIGVLRAGKKADLIAVSRPGRMDPMKAVFYAKRVLFSMIDGKPVLT